MNKKRAPEGGERELAQLMAPVKVIVKWIKTRRGFVIGVGILKGGTGKSTSVLYLALYFSLVLNLDVAVIDTDDNSQSVGNWCRLHEGLGEKIPFTLVEHDVKKESPSLGKRIKELRAQHDVVLVDLGGGDKETFQDLCEHGQLLFMPSAPSGWETSRLQATVRTAAKAARLNDEVLAVYHFFLKCNFRTSLPEEERTALETDLSHIDDEWIPVPMVHPYFDVSGAPHYTRSWNTTPKRRELEEFGLLVRHAMLGVMEEEEAA